MTICDYRGSLPEGFCKKGVLENFTKFTGKHLCQSLFLSKVAGWALQLYQKKTPAQVLFCEFCKHFKNTFLYRTPSVAASVITKQMNNLTKCVTSKWSFPHYFCVATLILCRLLTHKFTHILQIFQSCKQGDLSSSNRFLHLARTIIEQR